MLTSESDTGGESSMSGIVSGLAVFFLLSVSNLVLDSITYNKKDRYEGFSLGFQVERIFIQPINSSIDSRKMKPSGPQAVTLLSTHRFCRLLCPHGKFFRYKFFRFHSDKFCQGDFFSKNSMEKPLMEKKKKSPFHFLTPKSLVLSLLWVSTKKQSSTVESGGTDPESPTTFTTHPAEACPPPTIKQATVQVRAGFKIICRVYAFSGLQITYLKSSLKSWKPVEVIHTWEAEAQDCLKNSSQKARQYMPLMPALGSELEASQSYTVWLFAPQKKLEIKAGICITSTMGLQSMRCSQDT